MRWLNEPKKWSEDKNVLAITADQGTDFWRTTGYGYVRDSGHLYGRQVSGDFDLYLRLRGNYTDQYDQAGAMVRVDDTQWLKTGVEYFAGSLRFSTVITHQRSSWAVADLPAGDELDLRLTRRGDALQVHYAMDGGQHALAAICYLQPGREVLAGAMCAAPEGGGFVATFRDLAVEPC